MNTYARVSEELVHELFSTDGDMAEMFHPDMVWVDITDLDVIPNVGWSASQKNGVWSFSEPALPVLTDAELKAAALALRDSLLFVADEATAGMSDAYIAELLNADDVATFKAYAAYKLKLNKIDKQEGYPKTIDWPSPPA
ncbi:MULTISPECIES: tail fiber assembly protein [unclassified Pseudomonas]|uniref:tail fiber assembly protein n=1 Tax=unclassified Pseudomonas TaxID=196821 RepID=UPI002892BF35|nr:MULTISPECIES: tail fiber assembly protein [unclassified Pseudomonas]